MGVGVGVGPSVPPDCADTAGPCMPATFFTPASGDAAAKPNAVQAPRGRRRPGRRFGRRGGCATTHLEPKSRNRNHNRYRNRHSPEPSSTITGMLGSRNGARAVGALLCEMDGCEGGLASWAAGGADPWNTPLCKCIPWAARRSPLSPNLLAGVAPHLDPNRGGEGDDRVSRTSNPSQRCPPGLAAPRLGGLGGAPRWGVAHGPAPRRVAAAGSPPAATPPAPRGLHIWEGVAKSTWGGGGVGMGFEQAQRLQA